MERLSLFATISLLVVLNCAYQRFSVRAQEATDVELLEPTSSRIAVIDVGRVFREHDEFKAEMDAIKRDIADFEKETRGKCSSFQEKLGAKLKRHKEGSEEYKELEQLVTDRKADFDGKLARKRAEFLKREAAIYAEVYEELREAVAAYSPDHGIRLVMRYRHDRIDTDDRKSILQAVNRTVVFQDGLDITGAIIKILNANPPQT